MASKPVLAKQLAVQPKGFGNGFKVKKTDVLELKAVQGHFLECLAKTSQGKVLLWIDELNRGNVVKSLES